MSALSRQGGDSIEEFLLLSGLLIPYNCCKCQPLCAFNTLINWQSYSHCRDSSLSHWYHLTPHQMDSKLSSFQNLPLSSSSCGDSAKSCQFLIHSVSCISSHLPITIVMACSIQDFNKYAPHY